jgi:hypothetical protein
MLNLNKFAVAAAVTAVVVLAALPASAQQRPNDKRYDNYPRSSNTVCGENLVSMKRVKVSQIANVTDKNDVWVTEVCYGQDLGIAPNEGNVAAIRTALADNEVIVEKLWDRSFTEGDVISVKMIDHDTIQLFVAH